MKKIAPVVFVCFALALTTNSLLNMFLPAHVFQCWSTIVSTAMSDISWFHKVIAQTGQQVKEYLCSRDPITFET